MQSIASARELMTKFATDTGLSSQHIKPRRYLWTDAFAVCNFLQLYKLTDEQHFLRLALDLVDQVHNLLGQFRVGDASNNVDANGSARKPGKWLSGLNDEQARQHPTSAGLRIGKNLQERELGQPVDQALEWQQDGQYFHYLTRWMHALCRLGHETGNVQFIQWALELAKAAHQAFVYSHPYDGSKRIYWKMSVDLSRPLVDSMGQHDPLDGLLTYLELQTISRTFSLASKTKLDVEIREMQNICNGCSWLTQDALGIGGLLCDCYKLQQLILSPDLQKLQFDGPQELEKLLRDSQLSLRAFTITNSLRRSASQRLAFRELGLSIGLHGVSRMQQKLQQHPASFKNSERLNELIKELEYSQYLAPQIEKFWLNNDNQQQQTWLEHLDINRVMLATSLLPDGYLQL